MDWLNNKVRKYDNNHTRTALIWFWLFAFCSFAFVLSLTWPTMAFAWFPIGVFAFVAFVTGIVEAKYAIDQFREGGSEYENDETDENEIVENIYESSESPTPRNEKRLPTLDSGEAVLRFLFVLCRNYNENLQSNPAMGESKFDERGIKPAQYRVLITACEAARIVSPVVPGGKREVLVSFAKAVELWSSLVDPDCEVPFWQPVKEHYQTENIAPYYTNTVAKGFIHLNQAQIEVLR